MLIIPYDISNKLKIAVTTRALFKLEDENRIYEEKGRDAYEAYQITNENVILEKGAAFSLIKSLLYINTLEETKDQVEVIIVTRNNAATGLRVFNSIEEYKLPITRGCFSSGAPLTPYLEALKVDLFLTANENDAQSAIDAGIPAAALLTDNIPDYDSKNDNRIRIAFDGDAVIFAEDSELFYKQKGLELYKNNENLQADVPMNEGPFAKFLKTIAKLQAMHGDDDLIRTALITARDAPSHKRVIKTLREWNVRIDEMFFLGGLPKEPFLKAFGAQIFFDDQKSYTKPASEIVPSGTVPYNSNSKLNEYKN